MRFWSEFKIHQHCPKKLFLPQPQGFVMSLLPPPTHQTKLNSHKNLCKAVNLDQIGFDLSANEISAPDRRFVIDSVLDRGDPWSCRIWSGNNGLWVPKHDQLQMWQIASHDLGLSWPRTLCLAWIYRAKKPFWGGKEKQHIKYHTSAMFIVQFMVDHQNAPKLDQSLSSLAKLFLL